MSVVFYRPLVLQQMDANKEQVCYLKQRSTESDIIVQNIQNVFDKAYNLSYHGGSVKATFWSNQKASILGKVKKKKKTSTNVLEGINCGIVLLLNVFLCTYENILDDKACVISFCQLKLNNIWWHFLVAMQQWLLAIEQQITAAVTIRRIQLGVQIDL